MVFWMLWGSTSFSEGSSFNRLLDYRSHLLHPLIPSLYFVAYIISNSIGLGGLGQSLGGNKIEGQDKKKDDNKTKGIDFGKVTGGAPGGGQQKQGGGGGGGGGILDSLGLGGLGGQAGETAGQATSGVGGAVGDATGGLGGGQGGEQ